MYLSEIKTTSGGVVTSHSAKCPAGMQPRVYLSELVTLLAAKDSDTKLRTAFDIDTSKLTSATLTFAT